MTAGIFTAECAVIEFLISCFATSKMDVPLAGHGLTVINNFLMCLSLSINHVSIFFWQVVDKV